MFSADVVDLVAATLSELACERAFVLHGAGGLDEVSLAGETQIAEVQNGSVRRLHRLSGGFWSAARAAASDARRYSRGKRKALIREFFKGERGARRDIVVDNAAAALVVTDNAEDFHSAAEMAANAIASGARCRNSSNSE